MKLSRRFSLIFIIVYVFVVLTFVSCSEYLSLKSDLYFLYNRIYQLYDNIRNGGTIFFFYNDFTGVGHGSSFFYGYLTLLPFAPFCHFGYEVTIKVFICVTLVLSYLGVSFFASRFTEHNRLVACFYMVSMFPLVLFLRCLLYANYFAVALSFFFLGYCIDFFRDEKNGLQACLLFWLVFNSHLITSIISFIGCVIILIFYFNKNRLKDYLGFAILNTVLNLYGILNILYHIDMYSSDSAKGNLSILDVHSQFMLSKSIVGGILFGVITNHQVTTYFNLVATAVLVYLLSKRRHNLSRREKASFGVVLVGTILAVDTVWYFIMSHINIPIQFPIRYIFYFVAVVLIICFRQGIKKPAFIVMLLSCCFDLVALSIVPVEPDTSDTPTSFYVVGNGEYLGNGFVWDVGVFNKLRSTVTDQNGTEYSYEVDDKGLLTVEIPEHSEDLTLTLPKLYYNGYEAWQTGKKYKVTRGYSNFISVDIGTDSGTFYLQYKHPLWLQTLFYFSLILVCVLLRQIFRDNNCRGAENNGRLE